MEFAISYYGCQKCTERVNCDRCKEDLEEKLETDKNAKVVVNDTVYPGTKVVISDVSKIIKKSVAHCKFVKDRGDVTMMGI